MKLNALVVCREPAPVEQLQGVLDELTIECKVSHSAAQAAEWMVQQNYSALIVDFDLPGAEQLARVASIASPERRPTVFALVDGRRSHARASVGVHFVLYKPLGYEAAMRSLRGWQIFSSDRRRSPRRRPEALIYLQLGVAALPALVLDISERGVALQASEPLPPVQNVPLRFVLPGTTGVVAAIGEVIWADDLGRAGMMFAEIRPEARDLLRAWLEGAGAASGAQSIDDVRSEQFPIAVSS